MILLALLALGSITYAWLVNTYYRETIVEITTDNIDNEIAQVSADLYIGKDFDKNGVLDQWYEGNQIVNQETRTKAEFLQGNYLIQQTNETKTFDNLMVGKIISYNLVIKNESNYPINVCAFFDKLNYLNNESLVLFEINDISVDIFNISDYNNKLIGAYLPSDYTNVTYSDQWMYDLRNGDKYFEDVSIGVNQIAEVKFHITSITYNEAYSCYQDYYNNYYTKQYQKYISESYNDYLADYLTNPAYTAVNDQLASIANLLTSENNTQLISTINSIITSLDALKVNEENTTKIDNLLSGLDYLRSIDLTSTLTEIASYVERYREEILREAFTINKIFVMIEFITD